MGAFSYASCTFHSRKISIGRYCSIAWGISFGWDEHPTDLLTTAGLTYNMWSFSQFGRDRGLADHERSLVPWRNKSAVTRIGNDVWIGQNAYIKSGVTIGDGAVIGAFAVVTKDVPPFAIVVGNPGCVVRYRFEERLRDRIHQSQWWQYAFTDFQHLGWSEPERTIDFLEDSAASGRIVPYAPGHSNLLELIRSAGG